MTARERVARAWHDGSDHAAETPFGGPLCNCDQVAGRMLPMLRDTFDDGFDYADGQHRSFDSAVSRYSPPIMKINPYETEEDRHVDQ